MTSTPRLTNGHPPGEKSPSIKPRKAAKKSKKNAASEAIITKTVTEPAPAPAPAKPLPAKTTPAKTVKVARAKPAPAFPLPPKFAVFPAPSFDSAVDSLERSYKAAGQGAQALSAKLFDIARSNMTSGFEFWSSLATAKHPADIAKLQMSYWNECMSTLLGQARDLRTLSAEVVAKTNEPFRVHLKKSFKAAA